MPLDPFEKIEGDEPVYLRSLPVFDLQEERLVPFPGMNSKDAIICQCIAANQLLRDENMALREHIAKTDARYRQHRADEVRDLQEQISALKTRVRKSRNKAKKANRVRRAN